MIPKLTKYNLVAQYVVEGGTLGKPDLLKGRASYSIPHSSIMFVR